MEGYAKITNGSCLSELGDEGLWVKGRFTFSYVVFLLFGHFYHYYALLKIHTK